MKISMNGVRALVVAGLIFLGIAPVPAATGAGVSIWKNCTSVHRTYAHGVGKLHARDRTSGTPETNFRRSTRLYNIAMNSNRGLDRDRDGIACEQR
jgi:hypothetical protein